MVTLYEGYLAVHVLAAVLWAGGGLMMLVVAEHVRREGDVARTMSFLKWADALGNRLFGPAVGLLLLTGFLMAEGVGTDVEWGYPGWVIAGLTIFGISSVLGMAFYPRQSKRIDALYASNGSRAAELERELGRYFAVARVDLALLLVAVVDMALKPFD